MKNVGFFKTVFSGAVLLLPFFLTAKTCSFGDAWAKYVTEFNRLDNQGAGPSGKLDNFKTSGK